MCIIVPRLLISVHKWQIPRNGWQPWLLTQTPCPPIIFTNFSWTKFHNFFIMQNSKFTEKFNICSNWLLLQSIQGTCLQQMLNISVNFEFCIMRFSPWKIGEYNRWARCWGQYSWWSAIPWKLPFIYWNQQMADFYAHEWR